MKIANTVNDWVLAKTRLWRDVAGKSMHERQVKVLNRLLDGLDSKLTSSKWAAIAKYSTDTALRDIHEVLEHRLPTCHQRRARMTPTDV